MKVYKIVYPIVENANSINIFNSNFVDLFKNHCKLVYKNKIDKLRAKINIEDKGMKELRIKLISFIDIPYIDKIITGLGILYGFQEKSKINRNIYHLSGLKIKHSFYDVSMLAYKVNPGEEKIKIFGENFVKNNKTKYLLKYNNKYIDLNEYFYTKNIKTDIF